MTEEGTITVAEVLEILQKDWVWIIIKTYFNMAELAKKPISKDDFITVNNNNLYLRIDTLLYAIVSDKGTHTKFNEFVRMLVYIKNLKMENIDKKTEYIQTSFGKITHYWIQVQFLLDRMAISQPSEKKNAPIRDHKYYHSICEQIINNTSKYYILKFCDKQNNYVFYYSKEGTCKNPGVRYIDSTYEKIAPEFLLYENDLVKIYIHGLTSITPMNELNSIKNLYNLN